MAPHRPYHGVAKPKTELMVSEAIPLARMLRMRYKRRADG
jgi:hypothetical protein